MKGISSNIFFKIQQSYIKIEYMKKILLIINPEAYHIFRFSRNKAQILRILSEIGRVYIVETQKPGEAIEIAKSGVDDGFDLIISGGGDGTLNEVANGTAYSGVPIGILPLGITNVFALEIGIPMGAVKAAEIIKKGKVREIDLGFVNDKRYYTMMLGAGLDGYTVHNLKHEFKKMFGKPSHVMVGFAKYPFYDPLPIEIEIDGENKGIGYEVVISNISYYGGKRKMAPYAKPDDGELDIVVFRESGFFNDLKHFSGFLMGLHHKMGTVEFFRGTLIKLKGENVYFHVDSEPMGKLPAIVKCAPKALKVIVP